MNETEINNRKFRFFFIFSYIKRENTNMINFYGLIRVIIIRNLIKKLEYKLISYKLSRINNK